MTRSSQARTSQMSGGHALARMVQSYDPGPIFGMGGFQLLPFYEGARQLGLHHVLINDERAGAFAADAYARSTGKPGLCDGTLGPGATNLITALVESYNAGIPIVAFVGDTHRAYSWRNMTQESRQEELLRPAVKEYIRIEEISRIPELVRRSFAVATSGRSGPVALAVPEDVAHAEHEFDLSEFWADERCTRAPAFRSRPAPDAVSRAAELLSSAQRPVILVGGGLHLSRAYSELSELARLLDAPVAHTLSGKGALPCTDVRSVGLFGRYSRYANELIDSADALLGVGIKLGEIATKRYSLPRQDIPLIQLEAVPEEIGRWSRVSVGLWGDAREGMKDLVATLKDESLPDRTDYWLEIARRNQKWLHEATPNSRNNEAPVHAARLIAELNELLPPDATLVADGGFASHWSGLLFDTKDAGRGFVSDRGFASIGYGLPGAIGTKLGRPGSKVVSITGDGGFNMAVGELETARRVGLSFVLIVVNNAASGYVKALQHAVYGPGSYESSDLLEIDYARVAEAYGCKGMRVEHPDHLRDAILTALTVEGSPVVVDVVVTRDPARMLPAVDSRTLQVKQGDRPA